MYCMLCGNEQSEAKDGIGDQCRAIIEAVPMDRAMAFWRECRERYSRCCGGLATDKDHLFFHADGWEYSYPPMPVGKVKRDGTNRKPTKKQIDGWKQLSVTVEMGVSFYPDCAITYFVRDFDSDTDSEEFGKAIPYPADVTTEAFWERLDKQLDQAAEAAFNCDLLTCPECGYHYLSSVGPCGCESEDSE